MKHTSAVKMINMKIYTRRTPVVFFFPTSSSFRISVGRQSASNYENRIRRCCRIFDYNQRRHSARGRCIIASSAKTILNVFAESLTRLESCLCTGKWKMCTTANQVAAEEYLLSSTHLATTGCVRLGSSNPTEMRGVRVTLIN